MSDTTTADRAYIRQAANPADAAGRAAALHGISLPGYDRVAATPGGPRRLADARLRHDALHLLWPAQAASKLSVEQLAAELGVRRRAVRRVLDGNGDISVGTLARYLHAMGYEAEMRVVAAGEPRRKVVEGRDDYGAAVSAPLTDEQAAALRRDLADGAVPRRKATVLDDDAR